MPAVLRLVQGRLSLASPTQYIAARLLLHPDSGLFFRIQLHALPCARNLALE